MTQLIFNLSFIPGKGGKNRRRGKNENETEKRELVFKEDGQGKLCVISMMSQVGNETSLTWFMLLK